MDAFVEVTGQGLASGAPDIVRLRLQVSCEADSVGLAITQLEGRLRDVGEAARRHAVGDRDLQTSGGGVHPRYDRDGSAVVGYTAYQALTATVRDPARAGDVLSAVADAAGDTLRVDGIGLEIGDPTPLLAQARERAFADAQLRAEQYAALAGRALGPVTWVRDEPAPPGPGIPMRAMAVAESGLPVESGEHTVSATVAVRWEWS